MNTQLLLRPIRFPLKLKLISLFSLVLLTSLAAYAHYALTRFIEDKSAYIFSSVQSVAATQAQAINQVINESKRTLDILAFTSNAEQARKIFENIPALIDYRVYDTNRKKFVTGIADQTGLLRSDLEKSSIDLKVNQIVNNHGFLEQGLKILYLFPNKPIVTLVYNRNETVQLAQLSLNEVLGSNEHSIRSYLFAPDSMALTENDAITAQDLYKVIEASFLKVNLKQGVAEAEVDGQTSLVGFKGLNSRYPLSIAVIEKSKAYSVADQLIKNSYIFAVFLLSIAIIIGILFSRSLTRSLEILFEGTQKFVLGDFSSRVDVKSKDEIGALSDSFNFMGKRIVEFMEQMKEKVRLEREVEVAKLVQDSFFPESEGGIGNNTFSAFYAPASECGGDWWGHIEFESRTIFFIADATGHGVPAALITATANCALHTLEEVLKTNHQLAERPDLILSWFNKAICGAGKQLYMTMLCVVVDSKSNTLTWSNAAHNPAMILSGQIQRPKRSDLIPLLSKPSAHLGKNSDSQFEMSSMDFKPQDLLILFTDGITENTNEQSQAYGDRKFHQSIIEAKHQNLTLWREGIITKALDFSGGSPSDDDVTLVLCQLGVTDSPQDIELINESTVISRLDPRSAINYLCQNPHIDHLVGFNSPALEQELKAELPPILQFDFNWTGNTIDSFRLAIDQYLSAQEFPGWFESPRDYLSLIGDELVTNALAPESSKVSVSLSISAQAIRIEVSDNQGHFDKQTLLHAFKRAYEQESPKADGRGAGLGLYLVYQSTNQIWININKNNSTKVTCILEATKRYKNFKGRVTSFHFQQENK
tara:strand:- start:5380 stop:7836 length:2457 start_codon:yes stop_codon:yes gene_type:complete